MAACCSCVAFACAIGIALCIIALTKESLPIEERLIPLEAKLASTASTAALAHIGIVPVSIPKLSKLGFEVIIEKNAGSGVVPYLPLPELRKSGGTN